MTTSRSVLLAGHVTLDRHGTGVVPGGAVTYCGLAYAGHDARPVAIERHVTGEEDGT